jgi:hypothetical protein
VNRRTALVAAVFVVLVAALQPTHDAIGAAKHKAGVVVRHGDGTVDKMCVFFDEPTISGLDLLDRSGASYVEEKSALGSAICKLDGEGCGYPSEDCFCEYPNFWGYWVRDPDVSKWEFASTGAADHDVRDGSVDGWSWGKDGKPAPPKVAFDEVCPASANVESASPALPRPTLIAIPPADRTRTNFAAFGAFVVLFVLLAGGATLLRRRRSI